jgi:hypothetical protein
MKTRLYKPSDYRTFTEWWTSRSLTPVHEALIPKTTVVVESDFTSEPLAIACMYVAEGKEIADIAWVAGNPLCDIITRREAVKEALTGLEQIARDKGCLMLFTETGHKVIMSIYKELGFGEGDVGAKHFFKKVGA